MKKLKILTLVGTRPEIIKLSRVIVELKKFTDHILVHTGQNFDYELNEIFFEQLEISKPDYFLNAAGTIPVETIANVIVGLDRILATEKPDAFLLLGDTNSALGVISAKKRKIPIFHMEAGNRCFDQCVPEENNRKIVDHLSDINLPYTEHARRYLIAEGLKPEQIIKTGSPMREVLEYHREKINCSDILLQLKLSKRKFFLVSAHREENVDSEQNLISFIVALNVIAETWKEPIIVSTHPRTRQRLELPFARNIEMNPLIHFIKPLGFFDYVHLEQNARCVVSDSGTITEESSILNFPAVTIRQAHERPEGMDNGVLVMSGLNAERVIQSIKIVTTQHESENSQHKIVDDYQQDYISKNILRIIISYVDYVNRVVWKKT
ncbi:MAG: UDP-N-acetylglucosamine 2-epimerase (non-hydrolyzing) [Planctomycetaceae bacterium]|jgi:UDP-N-acetylglucosamine 2-epimerase (non-hydrolysing)|nr:UDP-N-acetylglucosamine 2-epimerase (non-hydrolyzing) [Planctomycetaceae bacterium]